jgi:hypothetical protein
MNFELLVATRYLRAKRKQTMISVITLIAILGVAAGVGALVVAMAVSEGQRQDSRRKLLGDGGAVPEEFLTAYGAALSGGGGLDQTLLPDEQRQKIVARRRRGLGVAVLAAAASAAFLLVSLDAWRARAAERLAADVAALEASAEPALGLQGQLATLDRRALGITEVAAARLDPLETLLVITRRLPPGAYLRSLRFSGGEWQVEGFAPRAAQVTQALGSAPELGGVRVLAATNRARTGEGTNESFALAFRLVQRP